MFSADVFSANTFSADTFSAITGGPVHLRRCLWFCRYQMLLESHFELEVNVKSRFLAGAAAGATATSITYPLDLMRTRMAAHWGVSSPYSAYSTAFREILRVEGLLQLSGTTCRHDSQSPSFDLR
jgi:hypothetical protein